MSNVKGHRTGSYPLMNLAEDFGLSLEVVYCAAWHVKRGLIHFGSKNYAAFETTFWDGFAIREISKMEEEPLYRFLNAINVIMKGFVNLQGSGL
jgi:hypothetical protein